MGRGTATGGSSGDDDDDDVGDKVEEAARPRARQEYMTRPLTTRILVRRMSRRGRGKRPFGLSNG